jgi:hypothetical protein
VVDENFDDWAWKAEKKEKKKKMEKNAGEKAMLQRI